MILDWLKESLENLFITRRKKRLKRKTLRKKKFKKRPSFKKWIKRVRPKTLLRKTARPQRTVRRAAGKKPATSQTRQGRAAELRKLRASSAYKTTPLTPFPRQAALRASKTGVLAGSVTHYFGKIQVAVIKAEKGIKVGDKIDVRRKGVSVGHDTVRSMQINHIPIDEARKGEEVGLKLLVPSQSGDEIFIL